jgi:hypothetical protein
VFGENLFLTIDDTINEFKGEVSTSGLSCVLKNNLTTVVFNDIRAVGDK